MATDGSNVFRAVPLARWMAKKQGIDLSLVKGSGPNDIVLPKDIEKFKAIQSPIKTITLTKKRWASSLARKLAEKKGISLERVEGTGNRGRIMMRDVTRAIEKGTIPPNGRGMFGQTLPMSQMRKVIAKRMSQSALTAPHIYFFTDVEMDSLSKLREKVLPEFEKNSKFESLSMIFLLKQWP